jgi:hypothetical protein
VASNNRDMQWAIGTALAFLLVVSIGGWIASGVVAAAPTPTPTPPPVPTSSPSATPTTSPTASVTPVPTSTPTAVPPTATPAPTPPATATPVARRMTSAELTLLLRGHVESQRVQFRDGRVRLLPPDQVVINGGTTVGGQSVAVEAVLTFGADANGRPKVLAYRLTQGGRPAAPEAQAALAARVTRTNAEIDQAVPRTQRVRRVWVTAEGVNGEFAE